MWVRHIPLRVHSYYILDWRFAQNEYSPVAVIGYVPSCGIIEMECAALTET
jgi:hypothetical protein